MVFARDDRPRWTGLPRRARNLSFEGFERDRPRFAAVGSHRGDEDKRLNFGIGSCVGNDGAPPVGVTDQNDVPSLIVDRPLCVLNENPTAYAVFVTRFSDLLREEHRDHPHGSQPDVPNGSIWCVFLCMSVETSAGSVGGPA